MDAQVAAPVSTPVNGGPVRAEDNIVNRKGAQDQSLFQICVALRRRLVAVPGFEQHLQEMDEEDEEEDMMNPVTSMWRCFRKGYPLMTIFNASNPQVPLDVDVARVGEAKVGKAATFKFLHACMTELGFLPQDCFLITDLYTDDTNGFVKVAKVVNRVLDVLAKRGQLYKSVETAVQASTLEPVDMTKRQRVIEELIRTEKDYIGHLEMLQLMKNTLEETGKLTGDNIYAIFLNLNNILDFQRRFLIRIEQHDQLDEAAQNWGQLFVHYQSAFSVYEPFIANSTRATSTVEREWEKIILIGSKSRDLQQMVASVATVAGFLLKPFQRMTKYPLLLSDFRKFSVLDEEQTADIDSALEAIEDVLNRANSAIDKEHRTAAVTELHQRVDDWKGIKRDAFGDLLLFGNFTVLKGDGGKDVEREVREYFDEFPPFVKALFRQVMDPFPVLRIAGMNQRAFTRRSKVVVRPKPMTPAKLSALTEVVLSTSRSVSRVFKGVSRAFSAHKKDATSELALEGSASITRSRVISFSKSVGRTISHESGTSLSPVAPSSALVPYRKEKHSNHILPIFLRRKFKAEDKIHDLPTSSIPGESSWALPKVHMARSQSYALSSCDPDEQIYHETPKPENEIPPVPPLPGTFKHNPLTPPTPGSHNQIQNRALPEMTLDSHGLLTPAASKLSRTSIDVDEEFADILTPTPTKPPCNNPAYALSFHTEDAPLGGDETPRAGSPTSAFAQPISYDQATRVVVPFKDSRDDLSMTSQKSQTRASRLLSHSIENLRQCVSRSDFPSDPSIEKLLQLSQGRVSRRIFPASRSATPANESREDFSMAVSRSQSRMSRVTQKFNPSSSRSGTVYDDLDDEIQTESQRSQSRTFRLSIKPANAKLSGISKIPRKVAGQAMGTLKASFKAATPITENFNILKGRRPKRLKMSDLIHTYLFDGPFSQANVFLHSCPGKGCINSMEGMRQKTHWKSLDYFERTVANQTGLAWPYVMQYSIYLFERILLCCKDINPTKQRPSVMGRNRERPLTNLKGKPRLQLKGRIFMANVTEIVSLSKTGSYTIQIFWKGDPGVENFIIRFSNEDVMKRWYKAIDSQRAIRSEERLRQQGTSNTQFNYLMNGPQMENPYQLETDGEHDNEDPHVPHSEFSMSRNASSTSLRSRSATGGSGGSGGTVRPPRFPMPEPGLPPLSLQTQFAPAAPSPSERGGNSYFSPVDPTPLSTRSSTQSGSYFPRQSTPVNIRDNENNRYTAPALSRVTSRESQSSYYSNGRTPRPSLQPTPSSASVQQIGVAQSRTRSASSPDIHNPNLPGTRRYPGAPPLEPVPPIPAHMASMRAPINRSQNNSPSNGLPARNTGQSQQYLNRPPNSAQYGYDQQPRTDGRSPMTVVANGVHPSERVLSPPISEQTNGDSYMPGQLKAKVSFEDNYVTLVIASNIHFRSLTDRVEAKLARFTNRPIGKNSVRLRYKDEDGDFVTIDSDEAVQEAFLEWREQHRNLLATGQIGQVGEIQLYCQLVDAV